MDFLGPNFSAHQTAVHLLKAEHGSTSAVAKATRVPKTTIHDLISADGPKALRDRETGERLVKSARDTFSLPWGPDAEDYRGKLIAEIEAVYDDIEKLASDAAAEENLHARLQDFSVRFVFPAVHFWWPRALDCKNAAGDRLHAALLTARALYDWGKLGRKYANAIKRGQESELEIEVGGIASKISGLLLDLLSCGPKGWYDGPLNKRQHAGARFVRLLAHAAVVGFARQDESITDDRMLEMYRQVHRLGYIRDSLWANRQAPGEVARLYNAWVVASFAARWSLAAFVGVRLLTTYGTMLETGETSLTPIVDDKEVWPALAAILVLRKQNIARIPVLASFHKPSTDALLRRLKQLDPQFLKSSSYADVLSAIGRLS